MKIQFAFQRAKTQHAQVLTDISITAKRYWKYPEKWIQIWLPSLTISLQYIQENETWMAVVDERAVAYYSLISHSVIARSRFAATKQSQGARRLLRREEHPSRNDVESLWLDNLWVLPEFMGQGIGKQLFGHALERSRVYGVSVLKIEADPNAQDFYEKLGAHKVGEHHRNVDDQIRILPVMEINL